MDTVQQDSNTYAYQFIQARSAIAEMSLPVSVPSAVSSNTNTTHGQLNGLRDSLNSLI